MKKPPQTRNRSAGDQLEAVFGERLSRDEALARHTSARIGGPAEFFISASTLDDVQRAAEIAWAHDLPLLIVGSGSNMLVSDMGVRGLVIVNRARKVSFDSERVSAESGANLSTLARRCIGAGLAGMEWAIAVPGTVGGAVAGNAGAHGGDVASCLESARILQPDIGVRTLANSEFRFDYRTSIIKRDLSKSVILNVMFALKSELVETIRVRADKFNDHRKETQPPGASIGSMFKNPLGDYAGRLIELAGLKGRRAGNAHISPVHANFFVNLGDASATDVFALINLAREEVLAQSGIELELEVQLVGEWQTSFQ